MAEKLKCEMEPKSWLIFQLSHQLINLLPVKFRDIVDEEALKEYRLNIIK
ncbi:15157_t:CDS:1, partial [Rhizophagus irregularis]